MPRSSGVDVWKRIRSAWHADRILILPTAASSGTDPEQQAAQKCQSAAPPGRSYGTGRSARGVEFATIVRIRELILPFENFVPARPTSARFVIQRRTAPKIF